MRLWQQLAFVMALLAVVPAALLGAVAIQTVDDEWREASELRVRRDARQRAAALGTWLMATQKLVGDLPASFVPQARDTFTAREQLGLVRLVFGIVDDAEIVMMVDERGQPVVSPVTTEEVGPDAVEELLRRLPMEAARRAPGEVQVGSAWAGPQGPVVPLAVQIAAPEGGARLLGVQLAIPLGRDPVEGFQRAAQGVGLLREDGAPLYVGSALVQPEQLAPLLGVFEEFQADDPEAVHGALALVPGSPGWTMVVVEPERALLRLSQRITGQILVGALLATLVGLLAAVGTALTVSRPVEQLRTKALQLAEGRLGVRMGIERNDEIGELATAFDHLSSRLKSDQARIVAQQAEIEAFNQELQSRVEERTQKLRQAQEQLVRTSQLAAVAELGAGLAHDLNNPLTGVLGLAQVLKERHPDDELIASLEHEAQRCRDVVSAMQRATTVEADPTHVVRAELGHIVQRATEWVAPSYAQRGVELVTEAAQDPIEASLDPDHGTRILAQVLQSVRSGLPAGSAVTVRITTIRVDAPSGAPRDRPVVVIEADRTVAEQPQHRDDWLVASRVMWVTVQLIDRLGGVLRRPEEGRVWQWVL